MKYIVCLTLLLLSACTSTHKAQVLDTRLEKAEPVSGNLYVGVKDDKMVVQRKAFLSEELRDLQYEVYRLEAKVYGGSRYNDNRGNWGVLTDCTQRLASVSNGGEGKLLFAEPREYVVPDEEATGVGLDESGKLITVSEEYVKDRIARFIVYKRTLQKRSDEYDNKTKACDLALEAQKAKRSTADSEE